MASGRPGRDSERYFLGGGVKVVERFGGRMEKVGLGFGFSGVWMGYLCDSDEVPVGQSDNNVLDITAISGVFVILSICREI